MSEVLGYLLSWTAYGTWLHGDERGWVESGKEGIQPPNPERRDADRRKMTGEPVTFTLEQRKLIEETIRAHCQIRKWTLHAVNARTNHVHVVVTADVVPEVAMSQLKAWCSRRLSEHAGLAGGSKNGQKRWWTEHGSTKWIKDEEYLRNAIRYVLEGQ